MQFVQCHSFSKSIVFTHNDKRRREKKVLTVLETLPRSSYLTYHRAFVMQKTYTKQPHPLLIWESWWENEWLKLSNGSSPKKYVKWWRKLDQEGRIWTLIVHPIQTPNWAFARWKNEPHCGNNGNLLYVKSFDSQIHILTKCLHPPFKEKGGAASCIELRIHL